jgi:TonB family protein
LTKLDYQGVEEGKAKKEVQATITNIGIEYRLLSPFTSFIAVEEKVVNFQGKPKRVDVPVEFPEGMNRKTTLGDEDEVIKVDTSQSVVTVTSSSDSSLSVNRRNSNASAKRSRKSISSGRGSGSGSGVGDGSGNGIGSGSGSGYGGGYGGAMAGIASAAAPPSPKSISRGVVNGKAQSLPKPPYPSAAQAVRASGAVNIQVTIDENGNVISATAVSGHPLLRAAAEQSARNAKFAPSLLSGQPVKVTGVVVYNFTNPNEPENINVSVGEIRQQTEVEKSPLPVAPEVLKQRMFAEKLHVWIYSLVERLQKGETTQTANETKFVRNGKAEVQIQFSDKTPEAVERLKQLGFEVLENKQSKIIVGRIAVEKIAALAEIAEVQYVLPKIK